MALHTRFGLALENFTPAPEVPDPKRILSFAERAESLDFDSVWAWDHIMLGSKQPFPFLESLTTLAAIAARTTRVRLGTGVLVLPLRNPIVLAKVTSTLDHLSGGRLLLGVAAGWYEKEFDACGIPFADRGRIFERNLDLLYRCWTEPELNGEIDGMRLRRAVMLPQPVQRPRPAVLIGGYVDRVLKRAATKGDGWLTYFYPPEAFAEAWARIVAFAEDAGRDPIELTNVAQLPICVADTFEEADRRVRAFIDRSFDVPPWSKATPESAIRGTAEHCAEQIAAHVAAGVREIVFVPDLYDLEQVQRIAEDVLPFVRGTHAPEGDRAR
jgi:alkanesulfonate monooxygenase